MQINVTECQYYFRVVVPLCGGNIDPTMLGRCIERGMSSDGRLIRFIVNVKDRPGGIAELTQLVASIGVRYVNFEKLETFQCSPQNNSFSTQSYVFSFV